jgi:flagellar L-ring protein precursor FlgH
MFYKFILLSSFSIIFSGCSSVREKISEVGEGPRLSQIQDPSAMRHFKPVHMPIPKSESPSNFAHPASLWQSGSKAFFKDQRARRVGDIIRVQIAFSEADQEVTRSKQYDGPERKLSGSITNLFGLQRYLGKFMPITPGQKGGTESIKYMDTQSKNESKGTTANKASFKLNFTIAATIVQILPNGNLVLMGRQEVGFDKDVRDIVIQGVIRPEDVTSQNTINADRISELRAKYSMRGEGEDIMRTPLAHELINKFLPF